MGNHTEGPWYANGIRVRSDASDDVLVATVGYFRLHEEELANARLIAAAPELLAALKAAVDCGMVPSSSAADGGASGYSIHVRVADQIRAAIVKATWSQP